VQLHAVPSASSRTLTAADLPGSYVPELDGSVIQHKAAANNAQRSDAVQQAAALGTSGASEPLPHLDRIQRSFGPDHDLSAIKAHTDAPAAQGSAAMGATAFATGNHVAFAGPPDLHTAAHEAAHVVQQAQGVNLYGGVGQVGDHYEQHADAVADRVVAGESAAHLLSAAPGGTASRAIQRKEQGGQYTDAMSEQYDPLAATWANQMTTVPEPKGQNLDGGSAPAQAVGGKAMGEAGYGRELAIGGTNKANEEMIKGSYGVVAEPVAPYTETLDRAMLAQNQFIEAKAKDKDHNEYHDRPWEFGADPTWVTANKQNSIDKASAALAMLERHEFEQWNWVNAYNSWAPFANVAGGARADLIETAGLLGFDLGKNDDVLRFVKDVEHGLTMGNQLVDAKVLGAQGDTSWADYQSNKGELGKGPEMKGEPTTPLMEDLQGAYAAVSTSQLGVYKHLLDARTKALKTEKASQEGDLAQINGVIAFWTNMAGLVDAKWPSAMNFASGKTEADMDQRAMNVVAHGEASRNWKSAATRAQAGEAPALQRAELERANAARERITGDASGGGMNLSLSGLVGGLVSLGYRDQIESIKAKIVDLSSQIAAKDAVADLIAAQQAMADYANKVDVLKTKAERLQKTSLANREAQYLEAGDSLDRYARAHASTLKTKGEGNLAPKSDKSEIYSTLMVVVAKIRAYMLMADGARAMFPYDTFVQNALALSAERRNPGTAPELQAAPKEGQWEPPAIPAMSKQENKVWESIDGNYAGVFGFSERARIQFEQVVQLVTELLQKMKGTEAKTSAEAQNEY
jgi:hypothetical protein